MKLYCRILWLLLAMLGAQPLLGKTWYVRPDGGTRNSRAISGQCDGMADAPYGGKGVNQHCAFNDFRYLWDDNSGTVGQGVWVMAGGDTVIVRGCAALPGQKNPDNPHCRVGWDKPTGRGEDTQMVLRSGIVRMLQSTDSRRNCVEAYTHSGSELCCLQCRRCDQPQTLRVEF